MRASSAEEDLVEVQAAERQRSKKNNRGAAQAETEEAISGSQLLRSYTCSQITD